MPTLTNEQFFQLALAAVGIAGATIAALVGALAGVSYQQRLTRPRLRVQGSWSFALVGGQVGPDLISTTAANVGPLPMQVAECGLELSDKQQMTLTADELRVARLPADLQPGQAISLHVLVDEVRAQLQREAARSGREVAVLGAYARDATGTRWRGPVNIKDLRASPRPS